MELRRLGTSGLEVSALSLGAMTFGNPEWSAGITSSNEDARRVLDLAVERGVNLVDTADIYSDGASEEIVGNLVREKRQRILLATKCRWPMHTQTQQRREPGPHDQGLSRRHIHEACEASLRRLKTDVIDLYQAHMHDSSVPIDETMRAFEDLVTAGKVRHIGCCNYTGHRIVAALWAAEKLGTNRYVSVQAQWSLAQRGVEREIIPVARSHGLGVLVWGPLANGFLSGKYTRGVEPPRGSRLGAWGGMRGVYDTDRSWKLLDTIGQVAARHATTHAAVSLAWLLAQPETSSVIVGARNAAQFEENLRALDVKLSEDDRKTLEEASRPDWGYPYAFVRMRGERW